jgi:hypothetical protein
MVKCKDCNREMLTAPGCNENEFGYVSLENEIYKRIPYRGDGRCHDCGAQSGHIHHNGCDAEICPKCGGQFLSCECSEYSPSYVGTKSGLEKLRI